MSVVPSIFPCFTSPVASNEPCQGQGRFLFQFSTDLSTSSHSLCLGISFLGFRIVDRRIHHVLHLDFPSLNFIPRKISCHFARIFTATLPVYLWQASLKCGNSLVCLWRPFIFVQLKTYITSGQLRRVKTPGTRYIKIIWSLSQASEDSWSVLDSVD